MASAQCRECDRWRTESCRSPQSHACGSDRPRVNAKCSVCEGSPEDAELSAGRAVALSTRPTLVSTRQQSPTLRRRPAERCEGCAVGSRCRPKTVTDPGADCKLRCLQPSMPSTGKAAEASKRAGRAESADSSPGRSSAWESLEVHTKSPPAEALSLPLSLPLSHTHPHTLRQSSSSQLPPGLAHLLLPSSAASSLLCYSVS